MTVMLRSASAGLVLLAAGACAGGPSDAPVRTTTASGTWTAPSAAQAAERDRALVRVVSAIPGVSRLDLFADGEKIAAGVEYKIVTPYLEVPAGRQTLRLRPAGLDTADPLAEESQQFSAGKHYTVVIMPGGDGGPAADVRVFDDPMDPPDEGVVKLRIIHAAARCERPAQPAARACRIVSMVPVGSSTSTMISSYAAPSRHWMTMARSGSRSVQKSGRKSAW